MTEEDLNTKYICEKTLLDKNDELVPIILNLIKESYKSGLCQTEFDNTMELLEENKQLKADYGNKAQVERDILKQENIDLKQKMIRILENIDVSYNDWKKWKDELKESDSNVS